jgi:hypothetical protein
MIQELMPASRPFRCEHHSHGDAHRLGKHGIVSGIAAGMLPGRLCPGLGDCCCTEPARAPITRRGAGRPPDYFWTGCTVVALHASAGL